MSIRNYMRLSLDEHRFCFHSSERFRVRCGSPYSAIQKSLRKTHQLLAVTSTRLVVCRARHTFLRVSLYFPIMEVKASPKPSQMEAKDVAVCQLYIGDGIWRGSCPAEAGYCERMSLRLWLRPHKRGYDCRPTKKHRTSLCRRSLGEGANRVRRV